MNQPLRIGIVGDFSPDHDFSLAIAEALSHAASALSVTVDSSWLPTQTLDDEGSETMLKPFDAVWCSGSPYKSMNGALKAIRFAREKGWPFIAT